MDLNAAWKLLGKSLPAILAEAKELRRDQRIPFLDERFVEAKKAAKGLMAKHHPDRGGDPSEFKRVQEALRVVEEHTEGFRKKFAEAQAKREAENAEKRSVFIAVDPMK